MTGLSSSHAVYFLLTLVTSLSGQSFLKVGVRRVLAGATPSGTEFVREHLLTVLTDWRVLVGVMLCGVGFVSWLYVLSIYDLGRAMPILGGLAFIAMFLTGWLALREPVSFWNALGVLCLVLGVYLLSLRPGVVTTG